MKGNGAGNNPMVGMIVACAVAIEEASKKQYQFYLNKENRWRLAEVFVLRWGCSQ